MRRILLYAGLAAVGVVYLLNASALVTPPDIAGPRIIAHRGVHQIFASDDVDGDTCTARMINPPRHGYIENTLASMQAAFDAGADVVELDVHLTPDQQFAVLHDWTLDCRTDGHGVTEQTPMSVLKTLDVGYGYTADGGRTYPLRGTGVGLMPTLDEVYSRFPGKSFLVNVKSNRTEEGEALAAVLNAAPEKRAATFGVYGGRAPTQAAQSRVAGLKGYDRSSILACLLRYEGYGWTGMLPTACQDTLVVVPVNYAGLLWGWPNRFMERMREGGSDVILIGPYAGGGFTSGIDTPDLAKAIPAGFDGYVWTNQVETIGPLLKAR